MHNRFADNNGGATEMNRVITSDAALIIWQRKAEQSEFESCQIMSEEDYGRLVIEGVVFARERPIQGKIEEAPDGRRWWIPLAEGAQDPWSRHSGLPEAADWTQTGKGNQ